VHDDLLQIVAALQRLVPLWPMPKPDLDRILIVKLDCIGDMVVTTPILDILRRLFPKARLDIIGHPIPLSLLDGDDRVAERIAYGTWLYHPLPILPPHLRDWFVVFRLLRRRYRLVVYLRGSLPFLLLGLTSRIAATKFVVAEPVIMRYFRALESLFGPLPHLAPRLHIQADAARFADRLLCEGPPRPRIVVHTGASTATRVWPPARFAALADQLVESHQARVHFLASRNEQAQLARIAELATYRHSFHCSLRLPEVVAVLATCDLFIGNDSGLAHIAAAVGTRMVVIWGSANLNSSRPKAEPHNCSILYHDLACRDRCPEFRCVNPLPIECLMRTQTLDVVTAARRLLDATPNGEARHALPVLPDGSVATGSAGPERAETRRA
jgi:heptosyltransferase-2/heptosyltransferase-3